ncbi:lipocalin-like domain-containing protein [Paraburkholderia sp. GAS334]|uniref:lipocalin-like domain-containing protein n=1 Tax=Paraburkholderia sp. GAS334 TaxID=3035131 RepID=UPI003D1B2C64
MPMRMRMRIARRLVLVSSFALCTLFALSSPGAEHEFAAVSPDRPVTFPQDSGAHPAYRTEWWYATGWLDMPDHKPLGFQITFFRSATGHSSADPSAFAPTQLIIAHAALSDPAFGRLVHDQKIARQGFGLASAKPDNTDVRLEEWRMVRAPDGHYDVSVDAADFALHLTLTPTQPPLLQGERGYSRKGPLPEQASNYYSEPQLRVGGSVTRPATSGGRAASATPVTGSAWLDHEWSSTLLAADASGWDWLGANLADGSALMAFKVRGVDGHAVWAHAALRRADGRVTQYGPGEVDFTPIRQWRSPRTNTLYPVATTVKTGDLHWQLTPLLDDQELDSRESTGAVYWEGAVNLSRNGQPVGRGYLELTGYAKALKLERR